MRRGVSWHACVRLGVGNAFAAWPRLLMLAVLAAAVGSATLFVGPSAFLRWLRADAKRDADGGQVLVARSMQGFDGPTCDRLARVSGVAHAGAVDGNDTLFAIRPGALTSWWTMTPGFRSLVLDGESGGLARDGMLVGQPLAAELALGAASRVPRPNGTGGLGHLAPAGVLPERGPRTDTFARSALVVASHRRTFGQCWVELDGSTFDAASAWITGTFASSNPDVAVAPLMFRSNRDRSGPPNNVEAWVACGMLLGLGNALFCVLRRIDSALLGLLGMSFGKRCLTIGPELLLADVAGLMLASLAAVGSMALSGSITRPFVAATGEFVLASTAIAFAVTLVSLAAVSRSQWFAVLREG
jgi:hypothetical protein